MGKIGRWLSVFLFPLLLTGCMADPYADGIEALENGQYEEAAGQFKEDVKK